MGEAKCRCGWTGEGEHLCHRCGIRPGKLRLRAYVTLLAGVQMKLGARETFRCDECWAEYQREIAKALKTLEARNA